MKCCKNCEHWTRLSKKEENLTIIHELNGKEIGYCHQLYHGTVLPVTTGGGGWGTGPQKYIRDWIGKMFFHQFEYKEHPLSGCICLFTLDDFYCKFFTKK